MKNIFEIAKDAGIDIPEEKKKDFEKAVNENYKTIAEFDKVKGKAETAEADLKTANQKVDELNTSIKEMEGAGEEVGKLKDKVKEYEDAEKARVQAEKERKADEELTAVVLEAIGDKEFVNEYTKNSIVAEVKKGIKEHEGKGAKDIFDELTKDKEGILVNPQQVRTNLPPAGGGDGGTDSDAQLRAVMGLPPLGKE